MKQNDFGKRSDTNLEKLSARQKDEIDTFDTPYDPHDQLAVDAFWEDAVLVRSGGPKAVREALREKKRISTTISLSPEVVAYFNKKGKGWQESVDEILMEYVLSH